MKTYEVLERALAVIEREEQWAQGQVETIDGRVCAVGALCRVCVPLAQEAREAAGFALGYAAIAKGASPVSYPPAAVGFFNDSHSHAEVVALFQTAIRNEKAKAGVPVEVPETQEVPA